VELVIRLRDSACPGATAEMKYHQNGFPEELQSLEMIWINQVWARDSGLTKGIEPVFLNLT